MRQVRGAARAVGREGRRVRPRRAQGALFRDPVPAAAAALPAGAAAGALAAAGAGGEGSGGTLPAEGAGRLGGRGQG